MTLASKLDAIRTGAATRIPPDKLALMNEATTALRGSGILNQVIKPGTALPGFDLESARGGRVSLQTLAARGAIVLTVFRGHW